MQATGLNTSRLPSCSSLYDPCKRKSFTWKDRFKLEWSSCMILVPMHIKAWHINRLPQHPTNQLLELRGSLPSIYGYLQLPACYDYLDYLSDVLVEIIYLFSAEKQQKHDFSTDLSQKSMKFIILTTKWHESPRTKHLK